MNLQLKRIVMYELHLPLKEAFEISSGSVQTRRILLLHLESKEEQRCGVNVSPMRCPITIPRQSILPV